jgi:isoquinoline 1-oxidoreductase beta subunit
VVEHRKSRKRAKFGELAAAAATQVVPDDAPLKDPKDFVYIGRAAPTRTDAHAKSTGTAIFTQDVKLPGMLTAVVLHPPRYGAKLARFDASKAKEIPGVLDVVPFTTPATNGVAVLAKDYWTAKRGRDALIAEWDETGAFRLGSAEVMAEYKRLADTPGTVAHNQGDVEAALGSAAKRLAAAYEFPFLAHASMEPMNCVVALGPQGCEVWNGEQFQTVDQMMIAQLLDLRPEQVKLNMLFAGGSFGRRANPRSDYLLEAAAIAKAIEGRAPVKLVWGREDDMRAGYYRPMYYHTLEAGLDAQGELTAWRHTIVGQSILTGTAFESMMVKDGVDATSVEGAANLPYAIPNRLLELHSPKLGVPVQWWRSVGSTHTAFSTECFLDEVARAAGKDPLAIRRALLRERPRHLAALELAAKQAGWGKPLAKDRARGIAVHESFNTAVAQVVEISRRKDALHIERVVCAVECGMAVNPQIVAMQMESGIGYGLSAALMGAITLKEGIVEQSNFHDYPVLRMNQAPRIEVHIVPSGGKPTGVGEPGTPVIAPALANALLALNGQPIRALPLSAQGIAFG